MNHPHLHQMAHQVAHALAATLAATNPTLHPSKYRKPIGYIGLAFVILVSCWAWYSAHEEQSQRELEVSVLRARQDVMYAVMDNDEYAVAVVDSEGNVVQWNRAMVQLTRIPQKEATFETLCSIMECPSSILSPYEGGAVHIKSMFGDPNNFGKVFIDNCKMTTPGRKPVPIRITVRLSHGQPYQGYSQRDYAVVWLQPQGTVVETGMSPAMEHEVERRVESEKQDE